MRTTRACLTVAAAVLVGVLAAGAAPASALPLPVPAAAPESLVTEGVTIEGPLINNFGLPILK
ncbi:hypothetical protein QQM39_24780 [Streptomyces sp. DT2A-34]|uniref:hypothetical protein n=1 Tax=Streptomyces sp. DT2A-34 TaxID=3051182 RepID=UPI00265BC732|nr:hypothetical protein [Streptomyces sp. DT2A-34]MDO0913927.1 hypothetical protein [Streptomyces sp. DT2A-34]